MMTGRPSKNDQWFDETLRALDREFGAFSKAMRKRVANEHPSVQAEQNAIMVAFFRHMIEHLKATMRDAPLEVRIRLRRAEATAYERINIAPEWAQVLWARQAEEQ